MELDEKGIAIGDTPEARKARKKFITNFYVQWNISNTTKRIYNTSLKSFIEVRFLSINETARIASYRYKSTLAVTFLTEILENAKKISIEKPKINNQNQKRFSEIIIMEYEKVNFGTIKLTIAMLRNSTLKIQYCITAIE